MIGKAGKPYARLVPLEHRKPRESGALKGLVMTEEFFDALPEEELAAWEGAADEILLDTHALLWWLLADERLTARACRAIRDEENEVFVSSVSAFEIGSKHKLGKLGITGFDPAALPI